MRTEADKKLDAEMSAALRRENRRRAKQEGWPYPACPHERVNAYGYCTKCGDILKAQACCERCGEPMDSASVPHLAVDDVCGDCIELAADYAQDYYKGGER